MDMEKRERFASRLGFLLISAGCAIGLGNVWRFPYIAGEYGGAAFVLLYLVFLIVLGVPVMVMEFSVGRASQKSSARSFDALEPKGTKWHWFKWVCFGGCYLLMMFYTTVAGWMLNYVAKTASGTFGGMTSEAVGEVFTSMLANPFEMVGWMLVVVFLCILICSRGLQKGVERVTKVMMSCLFVIMVVLCVRSVTLEGGADGLAFYLIPDFSRLFADGLTSFGDGVYAAMGQAFFTLSIGISSMAIFGSYIGKERRLTGEAIGIASLDTLVALMAGLIIFPACFAFGVNPGQGPSLVFITLPNVFEQMWLGQLWGTLFFLFLSFAALSTVIAVFEMLIGFSMDQWGWTRKKASLVNVAGLSLLSLPCALGFNVFSDVGFAGIGNIQDLEDFIVSNNLLPLGSLVYVLFCTHRYGWGWKNFLKEADAGKGVRFPAWAHLWVKFGIPLLIVVILIMGYIPKFQAWFGA
jgi:NSS family neurotransmitter:Na+ symporter